MPLGGPETRRRLLSQLATASRRTSDPTSSCVWGAKRRRILALARLARLARLHHATYVHTYMRTAAAIAHDTHADANAPAHQSPAVAPFLATFVLVAGLEARYEGTARPALAPAP